MPPTADELTAARRLLRARDDIKAALGLRPDAELLITNLLDAFRDMASAARLADEHARESDRIARSIAEHMQ